MNDNRLRILQEMPVFGGISDAALKLLLDQAQEHAIRQGEFYFREQDQGQAMFVLQTGKVAVIKTWEQHDYLLAELGPGDCFGELALIDFYPRSASVQALEDCRALELPNAALYSLYQQDIKQFTMIQMNMGREVSRRLRDVNEKLFQQHVRAHPEQRYSDFRFI